MTRQTSGDKVAERIVGTLTVKQLIEKLREMPSDARVVFLDDYGDHCHTTQALFVSEVDELDYGRDTLDYSAYSNTEVCLRRGDLDEEDGSQNEWYQGKVVLLS